MSTIFTYTINFLRNLFVTKSMPWNIHELKDSNKRVLICYIITPFYRKKRPIKHANVLESRAIAEEFLTLGYSVDVVDYRCNRTIDYSKYDVIFGFGDPFRKSFDFDKNITRICYLTGSSPNFSNEKEAMRIRDIKFRTGKLLSPRREAYWPWMNTAINSDMIILTGNDHTQSTYKSLNNDIRTVPVPIIPSNLKSNDKFGSGFLWFGGAGAIHKGLDLVLDASSKISQEFSLDICGDIQNEKDFFRLYQSKLSNSNTKFHGSIDVSSNEMQNLIDNNSFVILPSCSEGMASSVTTCMQFGLIPIISKECGIDIGDYCILIEELSPKGVRIAMEKALNLSENDLVRKKDLSVKFINENNTVDAYKKKLSTALKSII